MNDNFVPFYKRAISYIAILSIVLSNTYPIDGLAFPRKVLFEEFTSTTCSSCRNLAPSVESALDETEDIVVAIAYHMGYPNPGDDPWFEDNEDDNGDRVDYYRVGGTPTFYTDGGFTNRSENAIINAIEDAAEEDSPLAIDLNAFIIDDEINIEAIIRSEDDLDEDLENLTLHLALKEVHYEYTHRNGLRDHYNPMVKMFPDGEGTEFSIAVDSEEEFEVLESMEDLGWHELDTENLAIVAFVQDEDKNILQAAQYDLSLSIPLIDLTDWQVSDENGGDGDGRGEAGEIVDLAITISNHQDYAAAEEIEIVLSSESEIISILENTILLDSLGNGEEITLDNPSFIFEIEEAVEPQIVPLNISVSAQPNNFARMFQVNLLIGWPSILIIDATDDSLAGEFMRNSMAAGDFPLFENLILTNEGIIAEAALDNYETIIYHSFNNEEDFLTANDEDAIISYLDNGGQLVVSSTTLLGHIENEELIDNYLSVEINDADTRIRRVSGYENDIHFGDSNLLLTGGDLGRADSQPSINPINDAEAVLYLQDNAGENAGGTGIMHEAGEFRVLYLSFPFEVISGRAGSDDILDFLNRVFAWIDDQPLNLSIMNIRLDDSNDGDADGRSEAGETVEMYLSIHNHILSESVDEIDVFVTTMTEGVYIDNGSFTIDNLESGATYRNLNSPVLVEFDEEFETQPAEFQIRIQTLGGEYSTSESFTTMIGWPPLLIVDATGGNNIAERVLSPFNGADLPYADSETITQFPQNLENYNGILWHSYNSDENALSDEIEESLIGYLDDGGRLVMSSSSIALNNTESELVDEYLRFEIVDGSFGTTDIMGTGDNLFDDAVLALDTTDEQGMEFTLPVLRNADESTPVLNFMDMEHELGTAGVLANGNNWSTLFMSFPFEAISETESPENLSDFMGRIWTWVQEGEMSVEKDSPAEITTFTLHAAYPNPFNSSSIVPYSLVENGLVNAVLLDMNGRVIKSLFNSYRSSGEHNLIVHGNDIPSGTYLVNLNSAGTNRSLRITLIR